VKQLTVVAMALWLGAMGFFAFVVAPAAFATLEREAAGRLVSVVFPRYYSVGLALGLAALAGLGARWLGGGWRSWDWWPVGLVLLMLGLTLYAGAVVLPAAHAAREAMRQAGIDPAAAAGFARLHRLSVIEDASQATGALYKGRPVGGFGDVGCFSLYANKIITSGEGGMIVTGNAELARRMAAVRNFGQRPGEPFLHPLLGGNYKMTDVHAAIGCVQLDKIEGYIERRRLNVAALNAALAPLTGLIERLPSERPWARAVHFGYHMLFRTADLRQRVKEALHAAGIETRPFFSLITDQAPYRGRGFDPTDTPVAADLLARGLYVSNSPDLTVDDRSLIVDTLAAAARAAGVA